MSLSPCRLRNGPRIGCRLAERNSFFAAAALARCADLAATSVLSRTAAADDDAWPAWHAFPPAYTLQPHDGTRER